MRHKNHFKRLSMRQDLKTAFLLNMSVSLIMHGRVATTLTRAKVIRPVVEKIVTTARNSQCLATRRLLLARFKQNEVAVNKLFELAKGYVGRPGGYLRIMRTGFRQGDNAQTAIIEFV